MTKENKSKFVSFGDVLGKKISASNYVGNTIAIEQITTIKENLLCSK